MAKTKSSAAQTARVAALERLVKKYQDSYYNGEAEVSDAEFDLLWDELKRIDPSSPVLLRVGSDSTDGFPKARHLIPMGSQDKAANPDEFRAWAKKAAPDSFIVQYKLDGASLELQYEKGRLVLALTRGDGITGDDITPNALRMNGVIPALDLPFSGGVRGEVIMSRKIWREKYAGKANTRNAANGIMRRKDGTGCEDLRLITYDAAAEGDDGFFKDEAEKLSWLKKRGFEVSPSAEFFDAEEIIAYRDSVSVKRDGLPMDIDGLVVKDRRTDMADLRRPRPERQIAFKFELEKAVSILREVEWSESGVTYTPIGIVDPVRLAGTTVQRANLNNPDMIRAMGLRIGAKVIVVKRGEIIPKIEGLATTEESGMAEPVPPEAGLADIDFPKKCGTCGSLLEDAGTRLFCPNPSCSKRLLHRLEKWVDVLDIRELGEKLLRQLYEKGRVRHIRDLYTITVEELKDFERMGELSAAKVVRHIKMPRILTLAAFIAGFDFEGVGEIIMEKAAAAGFNSLEKLRAAAVEDLAAVHGLGEITARAIAGGLKETACEMDAVLKAGPVSIAPPPAGDQPLSGYSFCFTGELNRMKRKEAEDRVKALGGGTKKTVVKDLSYLVTNDAESGSAKNTKARELGVAILNEEEFIALLENPESAPSNAMPQGELF